MGDSKINLSRWILLLLLLLLLQSYHFGNAQPRTLTPTVTDPAETSYGAKYRFDPSMAIIVTSIIFFFFFVNFFCIYLHQFSQPAPSATASAFDGLHQKGLDPSVIDTFPIFVYSAVKDIKIGRGVLECAVCLCEFEDEDTLRLLPTCNHVFHSDCVDAWLVSHVTCPVCRDNLTNHENVKNTQVIVNESSNTEPNQDLANEIVINVNEDEDQRQSRVRITGKFPRSHSTGHSDKYTLKLPEEIRNEMIVKAKLKRTRSFNMVLAMEGSSRKGYRIGGGEGSSRGRNNLDRPDRWIFSMIPPFVSKAGFVPKSPKVGIDGDGSNNNRELFTAVKVPLNCLNIKVAQVEESSPRPPV